MSTTSSWVPGAGATHLFGLHNLAYGSARVGDAPTGAGRGAQMLVVRIGDSALQLAAACRALLPELAPLVDSPTLNALLASTPATWQRLRSALVEWLGDDRRRAVLEPLLVPLDELSCRLPFEVADFVDFNASEHHAANVGRLFRPGNDPLPAAWKHLPIAYHGRAGTVVVSGTPVRRPVGLRRRSSGGVGLGPSEQLDLEAELGFVLGNPTQQGRRVGLDAAGDHLFGVCLVNDWSARDIQAFESVPLGPFLGKSFATSVSPWVVPIEALEHARLAPPPRDVALATYLDDTTAAPWGLDIELSVRLNGAEIARPAARTMYWTAAQMVAHLTLNGASIRPGDLIASGTVSGPHPSQYGSLIELTSGGSEAILLPDGGTRSFLEDGDVAVVSAGVPAAPGRTGLSLGEVVGEVLPALPIRSGQGPR